LVRVIGGIEKMRVREIEMQNATFDHHGNKTNHSNKTLNASRATIGDHWPCYEFDRKIQSKLNTCELYKTRSTENAWLQYNTIQPLHLCVKTTLCTSRLPQQGAY